MISYDDSDYLRTAAIKRGDAAMSRGNVALAEWLADRFDCEAPINIELEWCSEANSHRLQIVFEHEGTDELFIDEIGNYDADKQAAVAARFLSMRPDDALVLLNLFVIFTAFEPVARWQANSAIRGRMSELQQSLSDQRVWRVHQQFRYATMFLHTEAQVAQLSEDDRSRCRDAYMAELLPHDEFGYFRARPIELSFDSKERFNREFDGNWFLYDR